MMLLPNIFPVTCHTKHVGPGSIFVAIKGTQDDGARYIKTALEQGASTIVIESRENIDDIRQSCIQHNAQLHIVTNAQQALAEYSIAALNNPSSKLKIIGITGTKGKTTTAYLVEHILRSAGYKTALLSTICNKIGGLRESSTNTTPSSDYLHMFFAECLKSNIEYVVMEVSSHALSMYRVHGIVFDTVGFLNLWPDHLDFHATLDDYFTAKAKIFSYIKPGGSILINTDNAWGRKAYAVAQTYDRNNYQVITFGGKNHADHHATLSSISTNITGISCRLQYQEIMMLSTQSLFGEFNAYNMSMAALICIKLGIRSTIIAQAISLFPGVPGRVQKHILQNGALAFVDYAHNAASFNEILKTLRQYTNHLIVVFGCGGNRPRERRWGMGAAAAEFADMIILTNDNPRFEDPEAIIADILSGIPENKHTIVVCQKDRSKAINLAASQATKNSIIALLGKGHENYFLVQGQTLHFDDFEEVSKF